MTEMNQIKDLIEVYTNLPMYSFVIIDQTRMRKLNGISRLK